jgi:hypothetical protein
LFRTTHSCSANHLLRSNIFHLRNALDDDCYRLARQFVCGLLAKVLWSFSSPCLLVDTDKRHCGCLLDAGLASNSCLFFYLQFPYIQVGLFGCYLFVWCWTCTFVLLLCANRLVQSVLVSVSVMYSMIVVMLVAPPPVEGGRTSLMW